ncbi:GntR family transcriptional regulator [Leucothrix arctica]|uniref:GntR family transcriptional regulator n=1 Tax=Leucothrix arctica TaxID=1481894 RepID=A0A317CMA8_9GAMM|nr:GntR family transcriptional regulator [Leucothrix arctica]PWQ99357.1 GntR family transcriptional regulator [Leucothrix arctica]
MSSSKKKTRLPLYVQVSELLHREIAAGQWVPGERLPTESQLAQDLDVAVGTLRKALTVLEEDGLLERRQGSGTYVRKPPEGGAVYQFFRLELLNGGGMPRAVTQSVALLKSTDVAKQFGKAGNPDKQYWRIRRLRYLNQTPVAAEEIWFDGRHAEQLSVEDMHESLYVHYREEFDFWMTHVTDEVSCQEAPEWACQLLNTPVPTTLGWISRQAWANNGRIEEYSQTWFDPLQSRYVARLS